MVSFGEDDRGKTMKVMAAIAAVAIATTAIAAPIKSVPATPNTPLEFAQSYLRAQFELEQIRARSEQDLAAGDKMMTCIRNGERFELELTSQISQLKRLHLATAFESVNGAPAQISEMYDLKRTIMRRITAICRAFLIQRPGIDYSALAADSAKITADLEALDKMLFQEGVMVFGALIENRESSLHHADHLVITRRERDELLAQIKNEFGTDAKGANLSVSSAFLIRDKLMEYKCADDPWD
jgi:hypothetical protein